MKEKREKRLNSEMRKLIYEALTDIRPAGMTEMFSVSSVNVTSDLEHADVYISVFGLDKEKSRRTFEAICAESGAVRRELGKMMHVRRIPELRFKLDESAEYGEKIDRIISGFDTGDKNDA